ncbi:MAG: hypothetical protein LIP77_09490 [Planctomycetes bacterium]|nr:hypothetical protein [Planctomycetota bacterium]
MRTSLLQLVLFLIVSTAFCGENEWFYLGYEYLAPAREEIKEIERQTQHWFPNVRGGKEVPDFHDALLNDPNLVQAVIDYGGRSSARIYDMDLTPKIRRILKLWLGVDGEVDSRKFAENIVDYLDGLAFVFAGDDLVPANIRSADPGETLDRFCGIFEAIYLLYWPTRHPVLMDCIETSPDPRQCLMAIRPPFPHRISEDALTKLKIINDMKLLANGYRAFSKLSKDLESWKIDADPFLRFLAIGLNKVILVNEGGNHKPAMAAVVVGRRGDVVLTGSDEGDFIFGGLQSSEITGGKGNDYLVSGNGDTVFHFYQGDGKDFIFAHPMFSYGDDTLVFHGRNFSDARITTHAGEYDEVWHVRISFDDSDDEVWIDSFHTMLFDESASRFKIRNIVFEEKTLRAEEILLLNGEGNSSVTIKYTNVAVKAIL